MLAVSHLLSLGACSNFMCKNATDDWPVCRPPLDGYKLRFGAGSADTRLPITAWWGPVGYSGPDSSAELEAYAQAGFTQALVGDRGPERCMGPGAANASWQYVVESVKHVAALGMQSLVDTYRCVPWGGEANLGGAAQGGPIGGRVKRIHNHKVTLPEVKWLARELQAIESAVGLLVTDDGVDLALNELQEIEWMRANTPELFPWVNQCGDGSEWLARAGTPYAVPELYAVRGPGGDADAMAAGLLATFDTWGERAARYGLLHWPLINVGDGGDTGLVRSESLVRFSAFAALAYGAKGIMWRASESQTCACFGALGRAQSEQATDRSLSPQVLLGEGRLEHHSAAADVHLSGGDGGQPTHQRRARCRRPRCEGGRRLGGGAASVHGLRGRVPHRVGGAVVELVGAGRRVVGDADGRLAAGGRPSRPRRRHDGAPAAGGQAPDDRPHRPPDSDRHARPQPGPRRPRRGAARRGGARRCEHSVR
jgi:hypothetical protein